jgi:hypothetical protein
MCHGRVVPAERMVGCRKWLAAGVGMCVAMDSVCSILSQGQSCVRVQGPPGRGFRMTGIYVAEATDVLDRRECLKWAWGALRQQHTERADS